VQADEIAAFRDRVRERLRKGDVWALSGSLPPGVPPDFYAQLVTLLQAGGARVLLDASGEPLRQGCAARPYLVKPNDVEAAQMIGREVRSDADARDAVEFFLQQGIELVALSLGADGLLLASQRRAIRARPPDVQARNPVGAGDALLAGVAWALERGLPLEEVARWGVAAGTAAAARDGVSVGTRGEVEALYRQVQIDQM
jgi:1-phosphofructokinase family hexose kinase